jgi:hypothetical protein
VYGRRLLHAGCTFAVGDEIGLRIESGSSSRRVRASGGRCFQECIHSGRRFLFGNLLRDVLGPAARRTHAIGYQQCVDLTVGADRDGAMFVVPAAGGRFEEV